MRRFENIFSSASATAAASCSGTSSPACSRRTFSSAASSAARACSRCSSGRLARFASSPALSFSQMRGTAKNQVGRTFGRKSTISRGSGQIVTVQPRITGR